MVGCLIFLQSSGEIYISAHTGANIVKRKPCGGVITLTTLFLMFIHLLKIHPSNLRNNEVLPARSV